MSPRLSSWRRFLPLTDITIGLYRAYETRIAVWMAKHGMSFTRYALALVFLWFGALKFVPGMSEAEDLARRTLGMLTFGHVPAGLCLYILATWECVIGLGLLSGRFLRGTLILLFLQLTGTFFPLFFFPAETWKHFPYAPTLEGQYIIKNVVLLSAAIVVGASISGGRIIADPVAARLGEHFQTMFPRLGKYLRDQRRKASSMRSDADLNSDRAGGRTVALRSKAPPLD